jgi:hypothetical protein
MVQGQQEVLVRVQVHRGRKGRGVRVGSLQACKMELIIATVGTSWHLMEIL